MYEVTVSPWDSRTLASPILWTAVKNLYKKDCYKNEDRDKDIATTFQTSCSYFFKTELSCQNWSGHGLTGLTGSYGPAESECWWIYSANPPVKGGS